MIVIQSWKKKILVSTNKSATSRVLNFTLNIINKISYYDLPKIKRYFFSAQIRAAADETMRVQNWRKSFSVQISSCQDKKPSQRHFQTCRGSFLVLVPCQLWLRVPQAGVPSHPCPTIPFLSALRVWNGGKMSCSYTPRHSTLRQKEEPQLGAGDWCHHSTSDIHSWLGVRSCGHSHGQKRSQNRGLRSTTHVVGTTHCTVIKVELEGHGAEGLDADRGNLLYTNPIKEDSGRKIWMQIFPNSGDGCK